MGRIKYSEFVDRIDVDALEAALGFEPLYNDGKGNDVGHCLFPENHSHGDTTGKFAIHREEKLYNCWVCGGGSVLSLVMELYNWSAEESEDWLRQFATGDSRSEAEFADDFLALFSRDVERRVEVMPYFNPRVLDRWDPAYTYGRSVGLKDEAVDRYGIRYVEDYRKLSPKNGKFADDDDYEGPAIVWPHTWNGRLVGWQARFVEEDRPEWVKKWVNTPDFPKNETLYGWDQHPKKRGTVLCESAKTVVRLAGVEIPALGTFGDSVQDAQLRLVRRFQLVMLAPDNDKAGKAWLTNCWRYLKNYCDVYIIPPVPGAKSDLASLNDDNELERHMGQTELVWDLDLDAYDWA